MGALVFVVLLRLKVSGLMRDRIPPAHHFLFRMNCVILFFLILCIFFYIMNFSYPLVGYKSFNQTRLNCDCILYSEFLIFSCAYKSFNQIFSCAYKSFNQIMLNYDCVCFGISYLCLFTHDHPKLIC